MQDNGKQYTFKRSFLTKIAVFSVGYLLTTAGLASAQNIGPGTTVEPYVVPSIAGVKTTSLLTVGDLPAVNGYRMVGIPDGLGAFKTGPMLSVLMNHELSAGSGIPRAHGSRGAFVSRWTIDSKSLQVTHGEDLTPSPSHVYQWNTASRQYVQGTTAWDRFCSADLPPAEAFFHKGKGTKEMIYLNGEESDEGRAWAHIASGPHTGEAWQLPRLGLLAWENVVASPHSQSKTVVALMDDNNVNTAPDATDFPSDLYFYVGDKQKNGHPVEQAGLTNGKMYGVKVYLNDGTLATEENNDFGLGNAGTGYVGSGRFTLVELGSNGDVSALSALQLQEASIDADVLRMRRIEDGAWDPRKKNKDDFYFVTTGSITTNSRLWRLRYDDLKNPEKGGTIEILLKGNEGHRMLDNIGIDGCGRVLMQEDVGNNARLGKIWLYGIKTGNLIEIARHNPKFFETAVPVPATFITQDEESSGIIDAQHLLGKGWFLLDSQGHRGYPDPELVQYGQLLTMYVPTSIECDADSPDDKGSDKGKDDKGSGKGKGNK